MSLPLPNLDDRRFEELLAELRTYIPRYAPGWTDHNPTDPGITLLEMFAWLSDMVIYRMNRVPDELYQKFRQLIGETGVAPEQAVESLWKPYRVTTAADFESLAIEAAPGKVARARCLENRNLEHTARDETGHISVVIVPEVPDSRERPVPGNQLKETVRSYLYSRRLLTARVHVVGPEYLDIAVRFKLAAKTNADEKLLETKVNERLQEFLHPINGGVDGQGWPLGRDVAISEIYRAIEETTGVDHTISVEMIPSAQLVELQVNGVHLVEPQAFRSYVLQITSGIRFPVIEARGKEKIDRYIVMGFKQGDHVLLTHKDDPYSFQVLKVKGVSVSNWRDLIVEPVTGTFYGEFPAGSTVALEDGTITSVLAEAIPGSQPVEMLTIEGFSQKESIEIKNAVEKEKVKRKKIVLTGVERCTDRVWLAENWLPWFIR